MYPQITKFFKKENSNNNIDRQEEQTNNSQSSVLREIHQLLSLRSDLDPSVEDVPLISYQKMPQVPDFLAIYSRLINKKYQGEKPIEVHSNCFNMLEKDAGDTNVYHSTVSSFILKENAIEVYVLNRISINLRRWHT
jgi:hypothetical protein